MHIRYQEPKECGSGVAFWQLMWEGRVRREWKRIRRTKDAFPLGPAQPKTPAAMRANSNLNPTEVQAGVDWKTFNQSAVPRRPWRPPAIIQ